jgi:ABC-type branched-subunit amino acid transport system substrate-binding protein
MIGMPLTGPLAALGKNELIGCQMAIDDINGKGGGVCFPKEAAQP